MVSSTVILKPDDLKRVVRHFRSKPAFAFDVESVDGPYPDTRGIPALNKVTWISMATYGMCVVIPIGHPIGTKVIGETKEPRIDKNGATRYFRVPIYEAPPDQMDAATVFEILRPLFFDDTITKVCHEATFDLGSVAKYFGEIPPGPYDDTKVIMRLIDENTARINNGLKEWIKRIFGKNYDTENVGRKVEIHPFGKVAHYSYMDSLYTWLLWVLERPQIDAEGLTKVWRCESDLIGSLVSMRLSGTPVDTPKFEVLREKNAVDLVELEGEIYKAAGRRFNLNAVRQKCEVIYGPVEKGGQGLKAYNLTDGGKKKKRANQKTTIYDYSTDAKALNRYRTNPVVKAMLNYADVNKLQNSFVVSFLGDPENKKPPKIFDGFIYPEIQQHGTVSGRCSGKNPNPQNIPRADTERGKIVRSCFAAPEGCLLCVADYGQIELVVLAHLIGYGRLYDGFLSGIDPHTITAAGILGKDPSIPVDAPGGVTKKERQDMGKTMNFTIVNGAGAYLVAEMTGKSKDAAQELLDQHEAEFPEIYAFKRAAMKEARRRGELEGVPYLRTILGRKRRMPDLMLEPSRNNNWKVAAAEREAFNSLIQGGAADIMKLSIPRVDNLWAEQCPEAYLTLTVHDELMGVVPAEQSELCKQLMVEGMTGPGIQTYLKVPLNVEANVGANWATAK